MSGPLNAVEIRLCREKGSGLWRRGRGKAPKFTLDLKPTKKDRPFPCFLRSGGETVTAEEEPPGALYIMMTTPANQIMYLNNYSAQNLSAI
jgi:hypothetical protein